MVKSMKRQKTDLISRKVTLYFSGDMGLAVHKVEARAFFFQIGQYAQYPSAVEVAWIAKGQRLPRQTVQTYKPSMLILEGWGHPDPASMWGEESASGGVVTRAARFSACSSEWQSEFDTMIAAHIEASGAKVVVDFRGHNAFAPTPAVKAAV